MSDQERGEFRKEIIATAAELMRDSDDSKMRVEMFNVLRRLGVIYER